MAIADQLAVQEGSEIYARTAICRAYYAALHVASHALPPDLQPDRVVMSGKSSHQAIIDAMVLWGKAIRPGRSEARIVARDLPRLKTYRKKADYDLAASVSQEEVVSMLALARATIQSADRAAERAAEVEKQG